MSIKTAILNQSIRLVPGPLRGLVRSIPGVAAAQRAALSALATEEFEHEVDYGPAKGLRLPVCLPRDKGFWKGTYEWEFCNRLKEAVQPGDVCFDIGAFRGYTAGVMALAGASRVVAFEPSPANQKAVNEVIALNAGLVITLVPAAVGPTAGKISFTLHEDPSMNFVGGDPASPDSLEVDVVSVDEIVAQGKVPAPQVMKIDVEGAEGSVLQGAKAALAENVREIFIEIHHAKALADCAELLADVGFAKVWQSSDAGTFAVQMQFSKRT
jgi:FkbM family methyltransferase